MDQGVITNEWKLIGVLKSEVLRLNGVLESFFRDFREPSCCLVRRLADVLAVLEEIVRLIGPQNSKGSR